MIKFSEYVVPLLVGERTGPRNIRVERYAGVAYFLDESGLLATCRHIVQGLAPSEVLLGKCLESGALGEIRDIRPHPTLDFASCRFNDHRAPKAFPHKYESLLLGTDVQALGFTNNGKVGENVNVSPRLMKGYVVRTAETGLKGRSRSTFEVSFPSHAGFSGTPVLEVSSGHLVGMLFGNVESSINVFSYSESTDSATTYKEKVDRILEFGVGHTASDIRVLMSQL